MNEDQWIYFPDEDEPSIWYGLPSRMAVESAQGRREPVPLTPAEAAVLSRPAVRTAIYRFFDADDQLLYIGITSDPPTRWAAHAREKWWWSQVKRRETTWFPSRKIAHEAEVAAIRTERPLYNGAHMAPGTKDLG